MLWGFDKSMIHSKVEVDPKKLNIIDCIYLCVDKKKNYKRVLQSLWKLAVANSPYQPHKMFTEKDPKQVHKRKL